MYACAVRGGDVFTLGVGEYLCGVFVCACAGRLWVLSVSVELGQGAGMGFAELLL